MKLRRWLHLSALIVAPLASPAALAATTEEVINGGACIPYPPYNSAANTFTGLNWQHWLYGFSGTAFCHLTMPGDWPVATLSYVLFTGSVSSGVMSARLRVHSGDLAVTCGAQSTISGNGSVNWVAPPAALPPFASGAFVQFNFPSGAVSTVREVIPVWTK